MQAEESVLKSPRQKFTPEEDCKLSELVQIYGTRAWKKIAQIMKTRTTRQCRERYINYLAPNLTNGPWSTEEDMALLKLAKQIGPHWSQIAKNFPTRSDVNVKNRYALLVSKGKAPQLKATKIVREKVKQIKTETCHEQLSFDTMVSPLSDENEIASPFDAITPDLFSMNWEVDIFDI